MKKAVTLATLLAACAAGWAAGTNAPSPTPKAPEAKPDIPLAFPSELEQPLVTTNIEQVFTFFGTNLTDRAVQIVGYGASCGCTTVEIKTDVVPPKGKLEFRAKLNKTKPAQEYAMILDDKTNLYQVTFKITPQKQPKL